MKKYMVVFSALALSACGGITTKTAPDELAVIEGPSLALPPSYDLRPPRSGENRTQEERRQARDILLSSEGVKVESSSPDSWLIDAAGGQARNPNIREELERELEAKADKKEEKKKKGWFGRIIADDEEEFEG
jgi:hypothetical protein